MENGIFQEILTGVMVILAFAVELYFLSKLYKRNS